MHGFDVFKYDEAQEKGYRWVFSQIYAKIFYALSFGFPKILRGSLGGLNGVKHDTFAAYFFIRYITKARRANTVCEPLRGQLFCVTRPSSCSTADRRCVGTFLSSCSLGREIVPFENFHQFNWVENNRAFCLSTEKLNRNI